jgi:hypothetical protein
MPAERTSFGALADITVTTSYRARSLDERGVTTSSKIMFSFSSVAFFLNARSGFLRFFNLYDKSRPENQTKRGEIDSFRTISKVLVYVFCSKRIDFRAILRNTLGTPLTCLRPEVRVTVEAP